MFKYTLIVSQYYHSYHFYVIKFEEKDYYKKFKKILEEICNYKRQDKERETYSGDIGFYIGKGITEIKSQYNLNDEGDIYIKNEKSLEDIFYHVERFKEDSINYPKRHKTIEVSRNIATYHNYDEIKKIIKKYYEIL